MRTEILGVQGTWSLIAAFFFTLLLTPLGCLAEGPRVTLNIPAGDMAQNLLQFYAQSHVQVLFLTDDVRDKRTHAVSGEFEASQALTQMLAGTGLIFQFKKDHSVIVRDPNKPFPGPDGFATTAQSPASESLVAKQSPYGFEMTVTGSHIGGLDAITAPLLRINRPELNRASYATVQDALNALPVTGGSKLNEEFGGVGNFNHGSAMSLRGLGAGATLTLVDGHRQPVAGLEGDFVDVALIPLSAVDHVDVLPEGSSALYGSDAIAGVVNIIMRKTLDGGETQARFGTAQDGAAETLAAQLFGHQGERGRWLFAYQFSQRSPLDAADRSYAADTDKRSLGGSNFSSFRSTPGNILDPATLQPIFAIPRGQDGSSLTPSELLPGSINWQNLFADVQLLPRRQMHNLYLTGAEGITSGVQLYGDLRFAHRDYAQRPFFGDPSPLLVVPPTNPFYVDAFGNSAPIIVAYNFSRDLGPPTAMGATQSGIATVGLKTALRHGWQASFSCTYGREAMHWASYNQTDPLDPTALDAALADQNSATALNPFGDGSFTNPKTLEAIRYVQRERIVSTIESTELTANGSPFSLPAGAFNVAVGAEHRRESLDSRAFVPNRFVREVSAGYSEMSVPLLRAAGAANSSPLLSLSLSGRYETYSDFGQTFNTKGGLKWTPTNALRLRGSWGTSFKAPNLLDLYDASQDLAGVLPLADPQSPTGQSNVLIVEGRNPNLKQETATSWTAGVDWAPPTIPGLSFSTTFYGINYADQIMQPGSLSPFDILLHENQWAGVITRNPPQALVDSVCNSPIFLFAPEQCKITPPTVFIDGRKRNLADTVTRGVDLQLADTRNTRVGHIDFSIDGTYIFAFDQKITHSSPTTHLLDTVFNPLALRVRGSLVWSKSGPGLPGLSAALTVHHTGRYQDPDSTVRRSVAGLTTLDLQVGYRTVHGTHWWNDFELTLNTVNLTGRDPPFVDRYWGYDLFNTTPTGRVISLSIQKRE